MYNVDLMICSCGYDHVLTYVSIFFSMSGSTLLTMTDVDTLSTNEWPSLLDHINITKAVKEIESSDLLGKWLDSMKK